MAIRDNAMIRTIAGIGLLIAVIYVGVCAALLVSQRSFIYFPQPRSFGNSDNTSFLQTDDARLVLTVRSVESDNALLYFGGNAEDVSASMPRLSATFPDHSLYLLHYRGYGGSSGSPSEASLHEDASALFDKVYARHPKITVIGRSLGSGVAIRLASVRPIARLVLITPFYSLEELAVRQFPFVPVHWILRDKFQSWRYAEAVKAPTTIVVAEHDEIIPIDSSLRLYKKFPERIARFEVIPGTGHNTISDSPMYSHMLAGKP